MHRRWGMLALIVLAQSGTSLLNQGVPILFAFLQEDFHLSRGEVGLLLAALEAGAAFSFVLGGWVADVFGPRRVVALSQALVGALSLAFAWVPSYSFAVAVLPLAGFAFGLGSPALAIVILFWFSARGRATAMGIKQTGVPIAGVLVAAILPSIALTYGWRSGILLLGIANFAIAAMVHLFYRDPPGARPVGLASRPTWSQLGALVRQRELLLISLFAGVLIADQYIIIGYLILYLRDSFEVPVVVGGLLVALAQAGSFCGRIVWGIFSDLALDGRRVPALALAGGAAAGLLVVLALLPAAPLWLLAPLAFGLGFSALGWHGLRQALVPELVPRSVAGMALGVSQTLAEFGPVLAPPAFGFLADLAGYRPAWLAAAALTVGVSVALIGTVHERRGVAEAAPAERRAAVVPAAPLPGDGKGS